MAASPLEIGLADLAKYPFLNEASDFIRQTHFDFGEFDRPEMQHIIERAAERIETEIAGTVFETLDIHQREILTFLVTLIIVKNIGNEAVLRKYSLFESMRVERFLIADLGNVKADRKRHLLLFTIFEKLFGMRVEISSKDIRHFKVRVEDYLIRASHFNEAEWKLINRLVSNGYVYLDADETVRLIRSELAALIYARVKAMELSTLPESIKNKTEELKPKIVRKYEHQPYLGSEYPPCIKHAIDVMGKGENLPHSARVMLATFMLAIGKPIDEIVGMFESAPDFNQKITRYQVEHLAGLKGSRTRYSVPSCEKLLNENLCFATEQCAGITSPLQFGRRQVKRV